jgi:hypothetical protein
MDTVAKSDQTRTGAAVTALDCPEHGCAVPGYLHLPDLAMLWQCEDCGEIWQVVADRRAPDSPLEFVWVKDPIYPHGPPELGRRWASNFADGR